MADSAVKVAVRVRPFNSREESQGAVLCVQMTGKKTRLFSPQQQKEFFFDYSYWSHDGFRTDPAGVSIKDSPSSPYADQHQVFQDLGVDVLDNAWQGYHCCLFAYGQTGSGKSYSMVGYGSNKGIIPIACEEIFNRISANQNPFVEFKVGCSMLQIYNEQVQDLLQNPANRVKGGLKVRQDPKTGVFVENLVVEPVGSYQNISAVLDKGNKHRTVAATQMNATSSRAHTVLTIKFSQIFYDQNTRQPLNRKESNINLVDLAGSERAGKTGATGERLQEGSNINQSLSTLGKVITALAKKSAGGLGKGEVIPYRESKLTRILQNALGGNSKTTMIAAISPALFNFEETMSTLRYADAVKSIKNQAVVNETPQERLIRELKEENEKLMSMIQGGGQGGGMTEAQRQEYERMIEEVRKAKEAAEMPWQQLESRPSHNGARIVTQQIDQPFIMNLNQDPFLSGQIKHMFHAGLNLIGKRSPNEMPHIVVQGLGVGFNHCSVVNRNGKFTIEPSSDPSLKTTLNGKLLSSPAILEHNARLKFGNHNFFLFKDLNRTDSQQFDWEFAAREANQDQVDGLLSAQEAQLKRQEAEAKRQLEAEIAQQRRKLDQQKTKLKKELSSQDSANQKLLSEKTEALRLQELAMEEQFRKKQERMRVHEENRLALERLRKLLTHALQQIDEANERAELLGRPVSFVPELYRDDEASKTGAGGLHSTQVRVRVRYADLSEDIPVTWSLDKMNSRLVDMQEMCNQIDLGDEGGFEYDPFAEHMQNFGQTYQLIGNSYVYLDMVFYLLDVDLNEVPIINTRGLPNGTLKVGIQPQMKEVSFEEHETLKELVGQELLLRVVIQSAHNIPANFCTNVYAQYALPLKGEEVYKTACCPLSTVNPQLGYQFVHKVMVTEEVADELMHNFVSISLYGDISLEKKEHEIENYMAKMKASFVNSYAVSVNVSENKVVDEGAGPEDLRRAIREVELEMAKIRSNLNRKEEKLAKKESEVMKEVRTAPKKKSKACVIF